MFIEESKENPLEKEWMKSKKFVLGTTENIEGIMDHCIQSGRYALDVETTGLDNRVLDYGGIQKTVDRLVGVCLSPDGETGYYIPLNHVDVKIDGSKVPYPSNVPWPIFEKAFRRLITATENKETVAVFHHGKFDQEFLQFWGGEPFGEWDKTFMWDDTLILAYLSDSRQRSKGLKALSKKLLNIEMIELHELIPDEMDSSGRVIHTNKDFSLLDPSDITTLWYGGGDGICTRLLYDILAPDVLEPDHGYDQNLVYKVEKQCVTATRWMERNRIHVDKNKLAELIIIGHKEWFSSVMDVYSEANEILHRDVMPGAYKILKDSFIDDDPYISIKEQLDTATAKAKNLRPDSTKKHTDATGKERPPIYDINAAQQLGVMFEDMGVEGLKRTEKSGQVKTSKDELDRIIDEAGDQFPFMAKIKRFREISKALSTYLYPMFKDSDSKDNTMRINFQAHKVDTGRFCTPAKEVSSKSSNYMVGWPSVNLQALPRSGGTQRPECMQRLRECITARRPNRVIVACDYSGVELRLVTNLSREPLWLSEFFHCSDCGRTFDRGDGMTTPDPPPARCPNCGSNKIGDLHTLTGLNVYGKEIQASPDWKEYRGKAKCVHPDSIIPIDTDFGDSPCRIGCLPIGNSDTFLRLEEDYHVWDGKSAKVPILETYNEGEKDLYHIVTCRGILTCSGEHKIALADGTLRSISSGLVEGDLLENAVSPTINHSSKWYPIKVKLLSDVPEMMLETDSHLAYLSGAFLGDGCKAGSNFVSLSHGSINKKDRMGVSYKEWQKILTKSCEKAGFSPKQKKCSIYIGSRHVVRIFSALELIESSENDNGKRRLRIPNWVLKNGYQAIMYFLGGLFDTDGTVGKRDGLLSVTTKDAIFAGQISSVLHFVGIVPYCEASWNSKYSRWYYRVRVSGSQAPVFKPYMKHPGKLERIKERQSRTNPMNVVKHIIPAGKMSCMDLHISSDNHLYWVSGLVTHNSLNFALCYGGGGSAAQRSTGVDRNEGNRLKRQFDGTYRTLKNWWDAQREFARKYGFVITAFKRRYPLPDIHDSDGFFKSKAERNAINGPIQGTSGDITKIAMGLIYNECRNREWLDKVQMLITMHDELVFEIDLDILEEAIEVINHLMTRNAIIMSQNWPIPLTTDVEIGHDWSVPWDLNAIKYGEVRFIGDKKFKSPKDIPAECIWDEMSRWPETLASFFQAANDSPVTFENKPPTEPEIKEETPSQSEEPKEQEVEEPEVEEPEKIVDKPKSENSETTDKSDNSKTVEEPEKSVKSVEQPKDPVLNKSTEPELEIPNIPSGCDYEYRLRKPLTFGLLETLSRVIIESKNSGTRVLKIVDADGTPIDLDNNYGTIYVNPNIFSVLAHKERI